MYTECVEYIQILLCTLHHTQTRDKQSSRVNSLDECVCRPIINSVEGRMCTIQYVFFRNMYIHVYNVHIFFVYTYYNTVTGSYSCIGTNFFHCGVFLLFLFLFCIGLHGTSNRKFHHVRTSVIIVFNVSCATRKLQLSLLYYHIL